MPAGRPSTIPQVKTSFLRTLDEFGGSAELGWGDISRLLDVSVNTARAAVAELEDEGLLVVHHGRGGGVKNVYALPWRKNGHTAPLIVFASDIDNPTVRRTIKTVAEEGEKRTLVLLP